MEFLQTCSKFLAYVKSLKGLCELIKEIGLSSNGDILRKLKLTTGIVLTLQALVSYVTSLLVNSVYPTIGIDLSRKQPVGTAGGQRNFSSMYRRLNELFKISNIFMLHSDVELKLLYHIQKIKFVSKFSDVTI